MKKTDPRSFENEYIISKLVPTLKNFSKNMKFERSLFKQLQINERKLTDLIQEFSQKNQNFKTELFVAWKSKESRNRIKIGEIRKTTIDLTLSSVFGRLTTEQNEKILEILKRIEANTRERGSYFNSFASETTKSLKTVGAGFGVGVALKGLHKVLSPKKSIFSRFEHILNSIETIKFLPKILGKMGESKFFKVLGKVTLPLTLLLDLSHGFQKSEEWFGKDAGLKETLAAMTGTAIGGRGSGFGGLVGQSFQVGSAGTLVGGILGSIFGGPGGALLGSRIGMIGGGLLGGLSNLIGSKSIAKLIAGTERVRPTIETKIDKSTNQTDFPPLPLSLFEAQTKEAQNINKTLMNSRIFKNTAIEIGTAPARIVASIVDSVRDLLSIVPGAEGISNILGYEYESIRKAIIAIGGTPLESPKGPSASIYKRLVAKGYAEIVLNSVSYMLQNATQNQQLGVANTIAGTGTGAVGMVHGTSLVPNVGGISSVPNTASGRVNYAMNYLMKKGGLTKEQASGIVGNIMQETGGTLNPKITNPSSGAFGLAQWLSPERVAGLKNYAAMMGKSVEDFETQLGFIIHEMQTGSDSGAKKAYELIRNARTPQEAAVIFSRYYERAGKGANDTARIKYAETAYRNFSEFSPNTNTLVGSGIGEVSPNMSSVGMSGVYGSENALSNIINIKTLDAVQRGVKYKMGGKNSASGAIDCSGWVSEVSREAGIPISGSAADMAKNLYSKGALTTDLSNIRPGSLIFTSAKSGKGHGSDRWGGIGHVVIVTEQNGQLMVSESSSRKGVHMTPLNEWVNRASRWANLTTGPLEVAAGVSSGPGTTMAAASPIPNLIASQPSFINSPMETSMGDWARTEQTLTTASTDIGDAPIPSLSVGGFVPTTQPILAHGGEIVAPIERVGAAFVDAASKSSDFIKRIIEIQNLYTAGNKSLGDIFKDTTNIFNPNTGFVRPEMRFESLDRNMIYNNITNIPNFDVVTEAITRIGESITNQLGNLTSGFGNMMNNMTNMISTRNLSLQSSGSSDEGFGGLDPIISQILRGDFD